jgi:hypothetical protein
MLSLKLGISETETVSWANHPMGAVREIISCFPVLDEITRRHLMPGIQKYKRFEQMPPAERGEAEGVITGALCWDIKNRLPQLYDAHGVDYHIVRYEDLIASPWNTIQSLLEYTGLPWHDNVLQHHRLHSGVSVGGTNNEAPIDSTNFGKWVKGLGNGQVAVINELCVETAQRFGYLL